VRLTFPILRILLRIPLPCLRIVIEITILVAVSLLQQAEQWPSKLGIHSDALAGQVTAHPVTGKALLEERLFVGAAAVEHPRGCISGRELTTFSP
jgi:hypothetical protein